MIQEADSRCFAEDFDRTYAAAARADSSPRKYVLHYLAGMVARRTGKTHLAEEQFRAAVQAKSDFSPAYEALAELAVEQGDFDSVTALVQEIQASQGESFLTHYLSGWLMLTRGNAEGAIEELRNAVGRRDSHVPFAHPAGRGVHAVGPVYARLAASRPSVRPSGT